MHRSLRSVFYIAAHVVLFGALFVPPIFIPNHGSGAGWEYHLFLFIVLWPASCFSGGILAGLIPHIPRAVRIAVLVLLAAVGVTTVLFSHVCAPQGIALVLLSYACGLLLGRLLSHLLSQTVESWRNWQKKRSEK